MSVDAEWRQASREEVRRFGQASADTESARMSRTLCDVMLDVLSRDNKLRSAYVRQRWQGLVKETEIRSDDRTRER